MSFINVTTIDSKEDAKRTNSTPRETILNLSEVSLIEPNPDGENYTVYYSRNVVKRISTKDYLRIREVTLHKCDICGREFSREELTVRGMLDDNGHFWKNEHICRKCLEIEENAEPIIINPETLFKMFEKKLKEENDVNDT